MGWEGGPGSASTPNWFDEDLEPYFGLFLCHFHSQLSTSAGLVVRSCDFLGDQLISFRQWGSFMVLKAPKKRGQHGVWAMCYNGM